MLINLSNHPSSAWSEEQAKAANEKYGNIVDLQFPVVPPEADIDDVLEIAREYTQKCMVLIGNQKENSAVHVMGEMTFTYNVVRYLSHKAIIAVASTTERIVEVDVSGQKTSVFRFKQFRKYGSESEIPF